jgi:hypothetical protein
MCSTKRLLRLPCPSQRPCHPSRRATWIVTFPKGALFPISEIYFGRPDLSAHCTTPNLGATELANIFCMLAHCNYCGNECDIAWLPLN